MKQVRRRNKGTGWEACPAAKRAIPESVLGLRLLKRGYLAE